MYESVTYETILQRMLDRVPGKLDKREGSVVFDALSPAAIELQILYLELDNILKEAYGDTASREYLILRCKERGIAPDPATKTLLRGECMPAEIDVTGKRFSMGGMNYTVIEREGAGRYKVQCESAGEAGNQYLGQMIPIEYIAGLETARLTEVLIPGANEEDTEHLRARYFASFSSQAFGGNRQDYMEKVNRITGVGCTKVTAAWNADIAPGTMIPGNAVAEWYHSVIGNLDEEAAKWLSAVYTAAYEKKLTTGGTVLITILDSAYNKASDVLLEKVQTEIDPDMAAGEGYGIAPIGHVVKVKTAAEVPVNVKINITFDTGCSWSNLQSLVDTAVRDYLEELRKTWADNNNLVVRISQIEMRILGIHGVLDVGGTAINGSDSNLSLGEFEIPVFGGVDPW